MNFEIIQRNTNGEGLYDITKLVQSHVQEQSYLSGILNLFIVHTSCAMTINEAYEPSAYQDLEKFLKHLAPRDLPFIEHTTEGPDDSPSHMKSMLLQQNLSLIIDNSELILGRWQGIYLAEFRDCPKERKIYLKFQKD
jgi:secondary thiamine-phosphate synthase enzyme